MLIPKHTFMPFSSFLKSRLLPVLVTLSLLAVIYINLVLVNNAFVGFTSNLRSTLRNHPRDSTPIDSTLFNTTHPTTSFFRRGKNFDTTVGRERAIILCLHDKMLNLGVSLIRELRCLGNQELIEVYYCGIRELSNKSIDLLFRLDNRLELVDVCSDYLARKVITANMAKKFQSWWIKPLAIYHTDVRHVLLLDADNVIFRDPAIVRSLDGYVRTGTTFFYDRVIPGKRFLTGNDSGEIYLHKLLHEFNYARFNVSDGYAPSQHMVDSFAFNGLTIHEMDSSMVLIDKARAGKAVMDILFWFITKERFRFKLSWGDKETFWLAFELARIPYFFSPWGISAVNSVPNEDIKKHPKTLCSGMLQYMPTSDPGTVTADVLYVNSKSLIDPYPQGFNPKRKVKPNNMFNMFPTHMTPRQGRKKSKNAKKKYTSECLVDMGSTPLPDYFAPRLLRRRLHFFGLSMGVLGSLEQCETYT